MVRVNLRVVSIAANRMQSTVQYSNKCAPSTPRLPSLLLPSSEQLQSSMITVLTVLFTFRASIRCLVDLAPISHLLKFKHVIVLFRDRTLHREKNVEGSNVCLARFPQSSFLPISNVFKRIFGSASHFAITVGPYLPKPVSFSLKISNFGSVFVSSVAVHVPSAATLLFVVPLYPGEYSVLPDAGSNVNVTLSSMPSASSAIW